jgi:anti-anti-sigma factor
MAEGAGTDGALPVLTIAIVTGAKGTRLVLGGELDLAGVSELDGYVKRLVESEPAPARLLLDPTALHFIDLVGARALMQACDRLAAVSVLEIGWLQPQVREVLELAGAVIPARARPDEVLEWVGPD